MVLEEVNANYLRGHLVNGVDVEPQLDFKRQLGCEMVEKKLDEETEAGGVNGRRLRERRGYLGDHELVTYPKYCGKWLVDENKLWRVNHPYQNQICNNQSSDCKFFTRRYCICTKELFLCSECYETRVLDADT